jgi:hypothetical protein
MLLELSCSVLTVIVVSPIACNAADCRVLKKAKDQLISWGLIVRIFFNIMCMQLLCSTDTFELHTVTAKDHYRYMRKLRMDVHQHTVTKRGISFKKIGK